MGQTVNWGDERMDEGGYKKADRYRARAGMKDLITIISLPVKYYSHSVNQSYITCTKPEDGKCLACENGYDRAEKRGCVIFHIGEKKEGEKKFSEIMKPKVWLFGADKWNQFCDHMDSYPELRKQKMLKCDFYVSCDNKKDSEKFQKLHISPTLQPTVLAKYAETVKGMMEDITAAKENLDYMTSGTDLEKQEEIIGSGGLPEGTYSVTDVEDGEVINKEILPLDDDDGPVPGDGALTQENIDNALNDAMGDLPF